MYPLRLRKLWLNSKYTSGSKANFVNRYVLGVYDGETGPTLCRFSIEHWYQFSE